MRRMVVVAAVAVFLVIVFSLPLRYSAGIRTVVAPVLSPLQRSAGVTARNLGAVAEGFGRLFKAAERARELEERVAYLKREVIRLREFELENRELRDLLDFKSLLPVSGVAARVIGRDVHHWYHSIVIDKGTRQGVGKDSPVLSIRGVVGRVVEASSSDSRVLLIVDPDSRVGGVIQETRQIGIVEGAGRGACRITYLPRRGEIEVGQKVVTSGLGQIYPPGLLLGTISAVYLDEYGLYQYADLEPATDFDRLERVIVLPPIE